MGPIFEAVRRHLPDFRDMVEPLDLMSHLQQLRQCDREEVTAGLNSHGRQYANDRLLPRLDGKVTFEQFITALRKIGLGELADRIEGSSAPAASSGCGVSSSAQTRPLRVSNHFENCAVNIQQGTDNVMNTSTSSAAQHQSPDTEMQSFGSDSSYDVVVHDTTDDREFDLQTLNALGVVGRSQQCVNSSDQGFEDDDETFEKQIVDVTDGHGTFPKRVHLPDETSLPGPLQPSTSQFDYLSHGRSQFDVTPADDACSLRENEAKVTVNNCRYAEGSEFQGIAALTLEDAAEEDTARKSLDIDLAVHPAAAADDDDDDDDVDDEQSLSLSVELKADDPAAFAIRDVEAPAKDSYNARNLLNNDLSSTNEAVFSDELHSDTLTLPVSVSVQQESPMNSDVMDDQLNSDSPGSTAPLDQHMADRRSWLHSAITWVAHVGIYIYRYASV